MIRNVIVLLLVILLVNVLFLSQADAQNKDSPTTKSDKDSTSNYNPWAFMIFVLLGSGTAFIVFRGVRPV